jgi:hypothetical protein
VKNAVERLIDHASGVRREREQEKEAKALDDHRGAIAAAKERLLTEFWCDECRVDVYRYGKKVVVRLERPVAFYKTFCGAGHALRRRITGKTKDPYYRRSEGLRKAVKKLEIDLLQPSDPRFRIHYPEMWRKIQGQA